MAAVVVDKSLSNGGCCGGQQQQQQTSSMNVISASTAASYPAFFTTQKVSTNMVKLSYTPYQLELLNAIYTEMKYPNSVQKTLIGKLIGITRDQVKVFVNKDFCVLFILFLFQM